MTHSRRSLMTCAALAFTVALSGCSLLGDDGEQAAAPTVSVPSTMPVTFTDKAQWSTELGTDTRPAVADEGIAVILPGRTSSSLYRVAMLSPSDGSVRWVSDDFENPTPDVVPTVSVASVNTQPWVIVKTQVSANEVQLDSYSPAGTGDRRTPDTTAKVKGADDKTMPTVIARPEGIVVEDTANPALADWEAEVKENNKKYEKAKKKVEKENKGKKGKDKKDLPKKPATPEKPQTGALAFDPAKGKTVEYSGPGELASAWAEGFVVTNPSAKSGFGFTVEEKTAWESATSRPANTDRSDKGTLLANGPGILVAEWKNPDGDPVLAVHENRTGKVLAVQTDPDPEEVEASHDQPLVQSADGKWASWGQYVFGLKGGPSSLVDLHGGKVRAIYQDVLYVEDATEPLTASAAAKAKTSPEPTVTPSDGGDKAEESKEPQEPVETFDGMIDAATGDPLTNSKPETVPLFVSTASQGVFVLSADGKTRLYSTPLS